MHSLLKARLLHDSIFVPISRRSILEICSWNWFCRFEFLDENDLAEHEDQCAICWEFMKNARKLTCGHIFHQWEVIILVFIVINLVSYFFIGCFKICNTHSWLQKTVLIYLNNLLISFTFMCIAGFHFHTFVSLFFSSWFPVLISYLLLTLFDFYFFSFFNFTTIYFSYGVSWNVVI